MPTLAGKAYVDFEGNYDKLQAGAAAASESLAGKLSGAVSGAIGSGVKLASDALAVTAAGAFSAAIYSVGAAARVQELNITLDALAKANHLSAPALEAEAAKVKSMGIETAVAQQTVAKMVQTQLDWSKSADLARVAQDAAVISGKNSTQTLQNIIQGITEGNVRVLRDNGIYISGQQAIANYAAQIGVTVKEMTEQQKQQAFLNAVLAQGAQIQGVYLAALQSPAKELRSLPRVFNDIAVSIGTGFQPALAMAVTPFYNLMVAIDKVLQTNPALQALFSGMGQHIAQALAPWDKFTLDAENFIAKLSSGQITKFVGDIQAAAKFIAPLASAFTVMGLAKLPYIGGIIGELNPIVAAIGIIVAQSPQLRSELGGIFQQLQPLFQVLMQQVSGVLKTLGPVLQQLIGPLGSLLQTFLQAFGDVAINVLPSLAQAIQAILPAIIPVINEIGGLIISLAPVISKLIITAAPIVVKLVDLFSTLFQKISPFIDKIIDIIGTVLTNVLTTLGPVIDKLTPILGELADQFGAIFVQVLQDLMPALQQLLPILGDALINILQALMPVFVALEPSLPALAKAFGDILIALIPLIPAFVKILDALIPILVPLAQLITSLVEGLDPIILALTPVISGLAQVIAVVLTGAIAVVTPVIEGVIGLLGALGSGIEGILTIAANIVNLVMAVLSPVINFLGGIKDEITGAFSGAISWLAQAGKDLIQGLINGIGSMFQAVKDKLGELGGDLVSWIPHSPAKYGPLRQYPMDKGGQNIMRLLIGGIESQVPELQRVLNGVANLATGVVSTANASAVGATTNSRNYNLSVVNQGQNMDEEALGTMLRRMEAFAL